MKIFLITASILLILCTPGLAKSKKRKCGKSLSTATSYVYYANPPIVMDPSGNTVVYGDAVGSNVGSRQLSFGQSPPYARGQVTFTGSPINANTNVGRNAMNSNIGSGIRIGVLPETGSLVYFTESPINANTNVGGNAMNSKIGSGIQIGLLPGHIVFTGSPISANTNVGGNAMNSNVGSNVQIGNWPYYKAGKSFGWF